MRKKIRQAISHPLVSGSAITFSGTMIMNLFNYLFNLGMLRLLTHSEYGTLAALISIINIFGIFPITIITVFTKFTASYIGQEREEYIRVLFRKGTVWVGIMGLLLAFIMLFSSGTIADFLKIKEVSLIHLVIIAISFGFIASVASGILQGLLKFITISIISISGAFLKITLGISLVLLGFHVFGAVVAITVSTVLGYVFTLILLQRIFSKMRVLTSEIEHLGKRILHYGAPVFLSSFGMTALLSIDIILVKHFFDDTAAGQYAAVSLIGRSINYAIGPIMFVFFPLIAQKKERKENVFGTLSFAAILISIPSLLLSAIYFMFPGFVVHVFDPGGKYGQIANYLGPFSIFIFFFSLSSLFNSFFLSINKTKISLLSIAALALEVLYIFLFHETISTIITGLIVISFLLFLSFLILYRIEMRREQ